MARAVAGDPAVDEEARIIIAQIKKLCGHNMLKNLDRSTLTRIQQEAGILEARAGKYWRDRIEQGPGKSQVTKRANAKTMRGAR